jgi:hypothetical protein
MYNPAQSAVPADGFLNLNTPETVAMHESSCLTGENLEASKARGTMVQDEVLVSEGAPNGRGLGLAMKTPPR